MLMRALMLMGFMTWAVTNAGADTLATWDFNSQSGSAGEAVPTSVSPGLKASEVGVFDTFGLTETETGMFVKPARGSVSEGFMITAKRWHGEALATNYFTFTLTPEPGNRMDITTIQFFQRTNATEFTPTEWALYASTDGFQTPLATGEIPQDDRWLTVTRITDLPDLSDLEGAVEFRLVATGARTPISNWMLDDLSIEGEIKTSR